MKRTEVNDALIHVFGNEVYHALVASQTGLPRMLDMAASKIVTASPISEWLRDSRIDCIRVALRMLQEPGYFTFEDEWDALPEERP